jgi:hypothetical protein
MLHVGVDDRSGPNRRKGSLAKVGALPAGLAVDPDAYDWFRAKVHEALMDTRPSIQHSEVMNEAQALIQEAPGRVPF